MLILITYDVSTTSASGEKRLRHIAKICQDYGVRVQHSVFECEVDPAQFAHLKSALLDIYDKQQDSLRFYKLGKKGRYRVEHYGAKKVSDVANDVLIL